jgi:hypothetical protein
VTTVLDGIDQTALGRVVLPTLAYEVTLTPTGALQPALARGVRLVRAETSNLDGFNPAVTIPVTQRVALADDPVLELHGEWQPLVPYVVQRSVRDLPGEHAGTQVLDQLLINPAQFRATSDGNGTLRMARVLVLEVTYVAADAPAALVDDVFAPLLSAPTATVGSGVQLVVAAQDEAGGSGLAAVTASYALPGQATQTVVLTPQGGPYRATIHPTGSGLLTILVEARDAAGNLSSTTLTVELRRGRVFLPLAVRP